jgi:hypothetical protein
MNFKRVGSSTFFGSNTFFWCLEHAIGSLSLQAVQAGLAQLIPSR